MLRRLLQGILVMGCIAGQAWGATSLKLVVRAAVRPASAACITHAEATSLKVACDGDARAAARLLSAGPAAQRAVIWPIAGRRGPADMTAWLLLPEQVQLQAASGQGAKAQLADWRPLHADDGPYIEFLLSW